MSTNILSIHTIITNVLKARMCGTLGAMWFNSGCMFYAPDKKVRCAIGHSLPNELISRGSIQTSSACTLISQGYLSINEGEEEDILLLQRLHDAWASNSRLKKVASKQIMTNLLGFSPNMRVDQSVFDTFVLFLREKYDI